MHEAAATEGQLSQQLVGKTFYLRGGYLDNTLHFNEKGVLDGSSPKASYTLSLVQIDHIKVDKHHVELQGVRYGLHFLGALPTEDQAGNVDKVKLTSKKKPLKITIDREIVVAPKKVKPEKADKKKGSEKKPGLPALAVAPSPSNATAQPASSPAEPQMASAAIQPQPAAGAASLARDAEPTSHGVTVTTSKAEADRMLGKALESIFSTGIDDRMVATFPEYWKLYYKSVAEKADYKPADSTILKPNQVDKKPHLLRAFDPPSNEYAQNNGVAGMAMYHVVVGPDGKPMEVAIGRPIGFGLDESAVEAIQKASFEPGIKDGQPVPVEVDLTVQFRIYSKRTAATEPESVRVNNAPKGRSLPGPYSALSPQAPSPQ